MPYLLEIRLILSNITVSTNTVVVMSHLVLMGQ